MLYPMVQSGTDGILGKTTYASQGKLSENDDDFVRANC